MSSLSIDDVRKLAALSALQLSDDEIAPLQNELAKILDYVEQLQSIDTAGVEPTYQVNQLESVMRPDQIIDYGVTPSELLDGAAELRDGQIVVPRVVE